MYIEKFLERYKIIFSLLQEMSKLRTSLLENYTRITKTTKLTENID